MSVYALIASIPARKRSCERLLAELSQQTFKPDVVILVLDGYGEGESPACSLPVLEYRTKVAVGAGQRWRIAQNLELSPDDVLVCLDDDVMLIEAPQLVEKLVAAVELGGGAAAAMGRTADGKSAPPGLFSRGHLIHAAGCGLTVRAKHVKGVQEFASALKDIGGPDALGLRGDDDALVSAFLWKSSVPILHAATGNIFPAPNTQASSQTAAKLARREDFDLQKKAIAKITGWPWRVFGG